MQKVVFCIVTVCLGPNQSKKKKLLEVQELLCSCIWMQINHMTTLRSSSAYCCKLVAKKVKNDSKKCNKT